MKIGDFVTGKDESYQRSIYEIVEVTEYEGIPALGLIFRALGNRCDTSIDEVQYYCIRPLHDFRIATDIEVSLIGIFVCEKYSEHLILENLPREIYKNEFKKLPIKKYPEKD